VRAAVVDPPPLGLGFNPKAFIFVNDYPTLAIAADAIAAIARNDTRLAEMRAEPVSVYPELYERLNWRVNNASAYGSEIGVVRDLLSVQYGSEMVEPKGLLYL
jgi:hypothetical protein